MCIVLSVAFSGLAAADIRYEYAISGYDPVAFQTRFEPVKGIEKHQLEWGGRLWLFSNIGNKKAFEGAPEVYAPKFAGCDPYSLAQGLRAQGSPRVFALHERSLYIFNSKSHRFLFLSAPEKLIELAQENAERVNCDGFR
ncbi:YHS domain-containing (seleno)protein [Pseudovibrio exalbescens]|uniref:YHS domain-containing (seleno)protein n=1 Tax=Pseudovibrio exalbescens TaxID=197461 RepID=UPI00236542E1|nr:YHS domain-containing (seleno)protein [Pseudovibrio exalbescens]MDD7911940.1 YHS domain-containing (seleno)protein [Pseudovibrio exalbescens]